MKAYIVKTRTIIEPFGDPATDTPVFNVPLTRARAAVFQRAGLEPAEVASVDSIPAAGPKFVAFDHLHITELLLKDFVALSRRNGNRARLGIRDSLFIRMTEPIQSLEKDEEGNRLFDLFYIPDGPFDDENGWRTTAIDPREDARRIELPATMLSPEESQFPITSRQAWHLKHWVHILRANYFGITGKAAELKETGKLRVLAAVLKARSINKWKVAAGLNRIGSKCDIHPTAIVEASELGDGVRIGANALVRGCVLGDGVFIEDMAQVTFSTLGSGSIVHKTCVLNYSVLYPGTASGNKILQFAVLGRNVITTHGSNLLDYSLTPDPIKVEHEGKLVSTGSRYIGCCLGHDVKLGIGSYVAPGRAFPNGYCIVRNPDNTLFKMPPDLPAGEFLYVKDGTLVPLRRSGVKKGEN